MRASKSRGPLRVVITGASSGIGQATAELFAAHGADLVLASRNREALTRVADACRAAGGRATAVPTDVTDVDAVQTLAKRAVTELGGIDVWFSNVGVGAVGRYQDTPIAPNSPTIPASTSATSTPVSSTHPACGTVPTTSDAGSARRHRSSTRAASPRRSSDWRTTRDPPPRSGSAQC